MSKASLLRQQQEFRNLVAHCGRDELAQGLRLLGMYVSLYKSRFGEVDDPVYAGLLAAVSTDAELEQLFTAGLDEAIAMLRTISTQAPASAVQPPYIVLN